MARSLFPCPVARANRDAEFVAAFNAGETLESIGKRYGVTRERVRQIVKRDTGRTGTQRYRERNIDRSALALRLWGEGKSLGQIAAGIDVDVSTARALLKSLAKSKAEIYARARMDNPRWSERAAMWAELIAMRTAGASYADLMRHFQISHNTVRAALLSANLVRKSAPKTRNNPQLREARRTAINAMRSEGLTYKDIAERLGFASAASIASASYYYERHHPTGTASP